MKKLLSNLWHKSFYMTGLGIAAVMGSFLSANVHAAVPNSATNAITGCYAQTGGAARIIDAQNGDFCTGSENTVTWPASAPQIAYLQLNSDGTLDTTYSRNIDSIAFLHNDELDEYVLCAKISFDPKVGFSDDLLSTNIIVRAVSTGNDSVTSRCGSGDTYNAVIAHAAGWIPPGMDYSYLRATFFN
jgi:hypothetical protein